MPQGWIEKMDDIRSAMRNIELMQLQWKRKMVEFHIALRDLEDMQKCDGKTICSAMDFFKRIEHHEGVAHKQKMINQRLGYGQEQSSVGFGRPVWQPGVTWPQPVSYQARYRNFRDHSAVTLPYGGQLVARWLQPSLYEPQHRDLRVDGPVTSPYDQQPVAPRPHPPLCLDPYPTIRVDGLKVSPHGHLEPAYSLAYIIAKVILSAPNQQMTSDHIYHWLRDNFGYYRQKGTKFRLAVTSQLSRSLDFAHMPAAAGMEGAPRHDGGTSGSKPRMPHYWRVRPDRVAKILILDTCWPLDLRQEPIMRKA